MVRDVKAAMSDKTDEVFMSMSRDYMEVILGKKSTGQAMPKWERFMRAAVRQAIEDREKRNLEADKAEVAELLEKNEPVAGPEAAAGHDASPEADGNAAAESESGSSYDDAKVPSPEASDAE